MNAMSPLRHVVRSHTLLSHTLLGRLMIEHIPGTMLMALTNLVVFFGLINFTMLMKDKFCMAVRACRQSQLEQTRKWEILITQKAMTCLLVPSQAEKFCVSLLTGVSSVGIVQPQSTLEVKRCEKEPMDNGC